MKKINIILALVVILGLVAAGTGCGQDPSYKTTGDGWFDDVTVNRVTLGFATNPLEGESYPELATAKRQFQLVDLGAQTNVKTSSFDFKNVLFGKPSTLFASVVELYPDGWVVVNGVDTRQPTTPFSFDWGDGTTTDSWFKAKHRYAHVSTNYIIKVTAHYDDGTTDSVEIPVRFVPPTLDVVPLPATIKVTIPDIKVVLASRMPGYFPPGQLTGFEDLSFPVTPRSTIEYVLSVMALIEIDCANHDLYKVKGKFEQVLQNDPSLFGGMYSLWYTTPVAFAVPRSGFGGTPDWTSFMHEMGHNVTLNSPEHYYYGGKIDGCANALFSESMAQIFQHATAHYLLNHYQRYGLSDDLAAEIKYSVLSSMRIVRSWYENYLAEGKKYASWNDPSTPDDETLATFMTIAYKFFEHAEKGSKGYRIPLKRMMALLQTFNPDMRLRYDQNHDTADAAMFRATLMVTALSYAFETDLREKFRDLNFPIDDITYYDLYHSLD